MSLYICSIFPPFVQFLWPFRKKKSSEPNASLYEKVHSAYWSGHQAQPQIQGCGTCLKAIWGEFGRLNWIHNSNFKGVLAQLSWSTPECNYCFHTCSNRSYPYSNNHTLFCCTLCQLLEEICGSLAANCCSTGFQSSPSQGSWTALAFGQDKKKTITIFSYAH